MSHKHEIAFTVALIAAVALERFTPLHEMLAPHQTLRAVGFILCVLILYFGARWLWPPEN